ncbi:MAG: 50S ribosomal protein L6 [Nitrospiraceae bacterium]|nr:50S ribosomal protein L6 [Nitrospiraceae bacterium]
MKEKNYTNVIKVPEGVDVSIEGQKVQKVIIKGNNGTNERTFDHQGLTIAYDSNERLIKVVFSIATKREKKLINTIAAHIKNMIKGVTEGFTYELEICSSHFPMNVSFKSNKLIVKNFLGEKSPRAMAIPDCVSLKIDGTKIILNGINKEKVGTIASKIESLTRITDKDRRIFQDGIFITNKAGKSLI